MAKVEWVWDWQDYFEPAGIPLKGIAAAHSMPDGCQSKRFVRREDLPMLKLPGCDLVVPEIFANELQRDNDVIMLTKGFWSSEALAHLLLLVWRVDRQLGMRLCFCVDGNRLSGSPAMRVATSRMLGTVTGAGGIALSSHGVGPLTSRSPHPGNGPVHTPVEEVRKNDII